MGTYQLWMHLFSEKFNFHITKLCLRSFRKQAIRAQETVMLMGRQEQNERPRISNEAMRSSKSVAHSRASKCMEEGDGLVHPIWTFCLDESVRFVAGQERTK